MQNKDEKEYFPLAALWSPDERSRRSESFSPITEDEPSAFFSVCQSRAGCLPVLSVDVTFCFKSGGTAYMLSTMSHHGDLYLTWRPGPVSPENMNTVDLNAHREATLSFPGMMATAKYFELLGAPSSEN
jgi:hypothetical protein